MKIFLLVIGLLCPFQATAESLYLASNVAAVETVAGVIGYVIGGVAGMVVGLAVPPAYAGYFADNHSFITLFPENATRQETLYALKQMEVRHLVLASFDRQFQPEFVNALSIQAQLSENTVKRLLRENPTPDGAANAVAAAMAEELNL